MDPTAPLAVRLEGFRVARDARRAWLPTLF